MAGVCECGLNYTLRERIITKKKRLCHYNSVRLATHIARQQEPPKRRRRERDDGEDERHPPRRTPPPRRSSVGSVRQVHPIKLTPGQVDRHLRQLDGQDWVKLTGAGRRQVDVVKLTGKSVKVTT